MDGDRLDRGKIGCTAETLRGWVRQAERDQGKRPGPTTDEQERIKALEREVRELRQANEILRKASAYFAQAELDRGSFGSSNSATIRGRSAGANRPTSRRSANASTRPMIRMFATPGSARPAGSATRSI